MKKWFRSLCCVLLFAGFTGTATAQDPVFSQALLSPVYLNPAATGAGEYDLRLSAIYRRQWWKLPSGFRSMAFSADKFVPSLNSGFGVMATHSSAGYLNRNGIYGTFAYTVCSGTASVASNGDEPKWFWSGGLQFGAAQTRVDYSKLVFADQLNASGVLYPSVSSAEPPVNSGRYYPDFGAGFFFNYDRRLLLGFSANHITRPDESLTGTTVSPVPIRWTANVVQSFYPDNIWALNISGVFQKQGLNKYYQVALQLTNDEYSGVSLGLYYGSGFQKGDLTAAGVTLSFDLMRSSREKLRVGFSHEAQLGGGRTLQTGGSSEMGVVWDYDTGASGSACKPKIIPWVCPK